MRKLYVAGIGPGSENMITPEVRTALQEADVICGYTVYTDLVREQFPEKTFARDLLKSHLT